MALPEGPGVGDRLAAEAGSLDRLAELAGRLGLVIAIENLAPVFPGPERLSAIPATLRSLVAAIRSPAPAALPRRRPRQRDRRPAPDRPRAARRSGARLGLAVPRARQPRRLAAGRPIAGPGSTRCGSTCTCRRAVARSSGSGSPPSCAPTRRRCCSRSTRRTGSPRPSSPASPRRRCGRSPHR